MVENVVNEVKNAGKEISVLKSLVEEHINALTAYQRKLVNAGVEPDGNRIRSYINSAIDPIEKRLESLSNRISQEIAKIDSWISEYENAEIILQEDIEKALKELYTDRETLEDLKLNLQRLKEELRNVRERYQEW
jgi:chromosome segregation ATPase